MLGDKRILCIEDNPSNQVIQQMILEQYGAHVFFERWGYIDAVIGKLEKFHPIHMILMDINLAHDRTGYELFQEIQKFPQYTQIPVVIVSANDPTIEIPKARNLGFAGFIPKPVSISTFPHLIANIFNGQPVWEA